MAGFGKIDTLLHFNLLNDFTQISGWAVNAIEKCHRGFFRAEEEIAPVGILFPGNESHGHTNLEAIFSSRINLKLDIHEAPFLNNLSS